MLIKLKKNNLKFNQLKLDFLFKEHLYLKAILL